MCSDKPTVDAKRRRRWGPFSVAALLILLAASAVAGKYWIIPATAHGRFQDIVLHYWDGTLEIDRMEGGYFDPIRASGLTLRDRQGRLWARADSVTLTYSPLPSISDQLRLADIEGLELTLHIDNGQCRPPVENVPDFIRWLEEQFNIEQFTVSGGSVATRCNGRPSGLWDGFSFVCRREPGGREYALALTRPGPAGRKGSRPGTVEAVVKARWPNGGKLVYEGKMTLEGLQATDLLATVGQEQLVAKAGAVLPAPVGALSVQYKFSGRELLEPQAVQGQGQVRAHYEPGSASTGAMPAEVHFTVEGNVVRIKEAHVATLVSNIHGFDAGRVDLATGRIDLNLTSKPRGGLIATLGRFAGEQIRMFATKTVRMHITGRWDAGGKLTVRNTPQD